MGLSTKTERTFVPRPCGSVKDGAVSGDIVETERVVWTDEGLAAPGYVSSPPAADFELSAFGKKFVGFGLLLLGLRMIPSPDSSGEAWILPGIFLTTGLFGLIKGAIESWGAGLHPFEDVSGVKGFALRFVWALRPRLWMLLWAAIIAGFVWIGSPHLRIQYSALRCDYLGLNGWEAYGTAGSCPLFKAFPLRIAD